MTQANDTVSNIIKSFSGSINALFKGNKNGVLIIAGLIALAFALGYVVGSPVTYKDNPPAWQKTTL
ncbi:MAG: hypothetical protein ACM3UL_00220 [Ignavibacteria bacterium]